MKDIKVLNLISGGRNGSLLLQSLLDSHPQVLQFPGVFFFDEVCRKIVEVHEPAAIAREFRAVHPEFFDSRLNTIHRLDRLGEGKDRHFTVEYAEFEMRLGEHIKGLAELPGPLRLSRLLRGLHTAYCEAARDPHMGSKRLLVMHGHHAFRMQSFLDLDFEIVFVERDPLPSLQSEVEGWIRYLREDADPTLYANALERKLFELSMTVDTGKVVHVARLEDIHLNHTEFFTDFCERFSLNWDPSLGKSTFMGMAWWGDAISKSYLPGLNPEFRNSFDVDCFYTHELAGIESFLGTRIQRFGYSLRTTWNAKFLILLPSKYESRIILMTLKAAFSRGHSLGKRLGKIGRIARWAILGNLTKLRILVGFREVQEHPALIGRGADR